MFAHRIFLFSNPARGRKRFRCTDIDLNVNNSKRLLCGMLSSPCVNISCRRRTLAASVIKDMAKEMALFTVVSVTNLNRPPLIC